MIFIESLMVALSTYSVIPMPNFEWNEKNMKYAIYFFPVVGIICGALVGMVGIFGTVFRASNFFVAVISVCIPLLITGGIHMDGFMDTVDAISSHQPKEKKLEIMSDPHSGAFSIIYCGIYLLLNTALIYEIYCQESLYALCPICILSRSISVICAVNLPSARESGMLSVYTKNIKRKTANIAMCLTALVSAASMLFISFAIGSAAIIAGILWTAIYCRIVKNNFGGVTGDTAGFFLQMFEISCIAGVWIGAML